MPRQPVGMPRLTSWAAASVVLGPSLDETQLTPNTRLVRHPGGAVAVRVHATDVVTYYPDQRVKLSSGGFRTALTRDRIRDCLPEPMRLIVQAGRWRIVVGGDDESVLFHDGMVLRINETTEDD